MESTKYHLSQPAPSHLGTSPEFGGISGGIKLIGLKIFQQFHWHIWKILLPSSPPRFQGVTAKQYPLLFCLFGFIRDFIRDCLKNGRKASPIR